MILSVSRRTDIPAFYSEWFMNRLREQFVLVRNPMNYHGVSKIDLNPNIVDCIVFWTKNAQPIFKYLDEISSGYMFYFQYTLNGYENDLEPNIPDLTERISIFKTLSNKIGKDRVVWRYDPIILSEKYNFEWHINTFKMIANQLKGYTKTCVFSFVDVYDKIKTNLGKLGFNPLTVEDETELAKSFSSIAQDCGIALKTGCEDIDLQKLNIQHSCCIDPLLMSKLLNCKLIAKKDINQRPSCGCIESIDIGQYNTCKHGCAYCYANYSTKSVQENFKKHDVNSPLLLGKLDQNDKISERKVRSLKNLQLSFFD